ncbi:MAG: bifunctional nuclease family protein [Candidatus Tectomicrobia bacterium]|nr:bifunctional nuclease family protein [Candidatus Tectomicrobia bacterium]
MVEMKVKGLTLDPLTNMPIVILKDLEEKKVLPIWVGIFEANAIALEMEQVTTPRPMTHDLIKNIIEGFKAQVARVVVNDLKDNTFYATITLNFNGTEVIVDSRPSDAIALALRVNAPIYVAKKVIEEARSIEFAEQQSSAAGKDAEEGMPDTDDWKKWLENLKPEDFGKYDV